MIAVDSGRERTERQRERERGGGAGRGSEAVGKMNSRWQSDNPVRSIGKYLPLRRRRTHAAAYTLKHALMCVETRYIHDGAETRLCTVRYAPCALRACRFMCKHRAGVCRPTHTHVRTYIHKDASAGATLRAGRQGTREEGNAHALCMNACTYTDRAGFIPGGTSGRARR